MTARENARVLYRFLKAYDMTAKGLVEMARRDRRRVEDILSDFITDLHEKGYSPGYMENYLKAVRSWLIYNDVRLVRRIKIGNRSRTPTIEDERVPTSEELMQILNYADERGRCSISLIAFAGLRPQVLGDVNGSDGLKVSDLPDLIINDGIVTFTASPSMVVVRPSLSKARHRYFTFIIGEGCEYIKAYLEDRITLGEEVEPDSAFIAVKSGYEDAGYRIGSGRSRHITTKSVTKEIRDAMRPRFKWRPYVLRAYFDTQLMVAENHGKISHAYRQFFMGHKGDIEARYTTNKGRLTEEVIEDMRRSFRECESYLSTRKMLKEHSIVKEAKLEALKSIAKSLLGIDLIEVKIAKEREMGRELGTDEEIELFENEIRKMREEENPQIIVKEEELGKYLKEGWRFVTALPSNKILIRKEQSIILNKIINTVE